jgi:hypothetical protein
MFACIAFFASCTSASQNDSPVQDTVPDNNANGNSTSNNHVYELLVRQSASPSGACEYGGHQIDIGYDDGSTEAHADNGVLDADEIDRSVLVCASVAPGGDVETYEVLTRYRTASLEQCPLGGNIVDVGKDNGDGAGSTANDTVLSDGEVDDSVLSCVETPPSPVYDTLTHERSASVQECPYGGVAIDIGLDNGDGAGSTANDTVLSEGEVDDSALTCIETPTSPVYATLTHERSASVQECPYGGVAIDIGLDNGDGAGSTANDTVLSEGEVDDSVNTCNDPPPETYPDAPLLNDELEASVQQCPSGGVREVSGLDNGDGEGVPLNGTLEPGEIDTTTLVCETATPTVRAYNNISLPRVAIVPSNRGNSRTGVSDFPTDADYFKDAIQYQNYDVTDSAFDDINQLICMLNESRYLEMLERGHSTYMARIHDYQCLAKGKGQYEFRGLKTLTYPSYSDWVVQVSRPSWSAYPISVKFWGTRLSYNTPSSAATNIGAIKKFYISGDLRVYSAPTTGNPYGEIILRAEQSYYLREDMPHLIYRMSLSVLNQQQNNQEVVKTSYFWSHLYPWNNGYPLVKASIVRDPSGATGYGSVLIEDGFDYSVPGGAGAFKYYNFRHTEEELTRSSTRFIDVTKISPNIQSPTDAVFETHNFDRTSMKQTTRGYGFYNDRGERIQEGYAAFGLWLDSGLSTQVFADCQNWACRIRTSPYDYSGFIPNRTSFITAHVYGGDGREIFLNITPGVMQRTKQTSIVWRPDDGWEGPTRLACVSGCIDPRLLASHDIYYVTDASNPQFYDFNPQTYELSQTISGVKWVVAQSNPDRPVVSMGLFGASTENLNAVAGGANPNTLDVYYTWSTGPSMQDRLALPRETDGTPIAFGYDIHGWNYPNTGNTEFPGARVARVNLSYNDWIYDLGDLCLDKQTNEPVECYAAGSRVLPQISIPADTLLQWAGRDYYIKPVAVETRLTWLPDAVSLPLETVVLPDQNAGAGPLREQSPSVCGGPAVDRGETTSTAEGAILWAPRGGTFVVCPEGQQLSGGSWRGVVSNYGPVYSSSDTCALTRNDGYCDLECADDGSDCL